MRRNYFFASALVALGVAAWTGSAQAGFTTINAPHAGEQSIGQIITNLYGGYGGALHADGLNYTNGLITLLRVEDTPTSGAVNLGQFPLGGATDQLWTGNVVSALAYGHFSAAKPSFGYYPGASGDSFVKLMDITANGIITPVVSPSNDLNQTFRWVMKTASFASSKPSDNAGKDRMVTYEVLNYNHETTPRWMLFFEDGSDFDFNDIAVEVESGAPRSLVTIPEPATMLVWLGLAGAALVWWRRR